MEKKTFNKDLIIVFLGTIVMLFVMLLVIGMKSTNPVGNTTTGTTMTNDKSIYMQGCLEKAAGATWAYDYCSCTYDFILNRYGMNAFTEYNEDSEYSKTVIDDAFDNCKYLVK